MQLLFLQQPFQLLLLFDIGMGTDHAQRLAIGGARDHAAPVQYPAPLAIGLAETELRAVLLAQATQMLFQCGPHLGDVLAVHAGQHLGGGFIAHCRGAHHTVTGNVPVPQAVAGTVQRQLPAPTAAERHRFGNAQREGQQVAGAIVHGAQVAIVVSVRATRQRAGHDAAIGSHQAQIFQHRRIRSHGGRQAMLARSRIGRQRAARAVDDDQRRRKRVLQQAGDDPLVHAILLRMTRPSAGHAVVNGACGG